MRLIRTLVTTNDGLRKCRCLALNFSLNFCRTCELINRRRVPTVYRLQSPCVRLDEPLIKNVMDSQPSTPVMDEHLDDLTVKLLKQWDWKNGDGSFVSGQRTLHCASSSPESSIDSMCSSPEMPGNASACQPFANFSYTISGHSSAHRTPQKTSKSKMSTKRRIKASEREKMRMRSLAEALHHLRDYLPPDYSRRGQPLTKIQTLKYTIEYIKELSDILNHS